MTPTWYQGAIIASCGITAIEYMNRTQGFTSFLGALPWTWPLILFAQWGLFYCWRDAPNNMLVGWAVFFTVNTVLRMGNVLYVGEPVSPWVWLGTGLILAGAAVTRVGS